MVVFIYQFSFSSFFPLPSSSYSMTSVPSLLCVHIICAACLCNVWFFFFYCVLSVPSTLQRRNWAGWWHSRLDFDITTPRKQHLDIWDDWVRGIKDPRMSGYQIKVQGCVPEPWALFMHCLKWECQSEVKLHEDETIILPLTSHTQYSTRDSIALDTHFLLRNIKLPLLHC